MHASPSRFDHAASCVSIGDHVTMCLPVTFRFGLAYGEGPSPNQFCGDALFALNRYSTSFTGTGNGYWTDFFYQWAFSATAVTIPAGSVAERFNFNAYLGKSNETYLLLLYRCKKA